MHPTPFSYVCVVALGAILLTLLWWHRLSRLHSRGRVRPRRGQQTPRPRTPDDCGACRALQSCPASLVPPAPVQPWREIKSRRGAPKRLNTEGYACPSPRCAYYGITEASIHALVGNDHLGTTDHIQDLRCQACGTKVSSRRGTPVLLHIAGMG
jgi:hypothetical protein